MKPYWTLLSFMNVLALLLLHHRLEIKRQPFGPARHHQQCPLDFPESSADHHPVIMAQRQTCPFSSSPREDIQESRYPRLLWKAQCICQNSCVSLRHPVENATQKSFVHKEENGVSVQIFADTTVYYRRPCANVNKSFYLERQKYPLPVACTCVAIP
uniref:Interleukin 17C n=1 Tax=Podarcis muralis TaxID=64176 RepID=A0A670KA03_PODMU